MENYPPKWLLQNIGTTQLPPVLGNALYVHSLGNALLAFSRSLYMQSISNTFVTQPGILSILENTQNAIRSMPNIDFSAINSSIVGFGVWSSALQSTILSASTPCPNLLESIANSLVLSDPYLTKEVIEQCDELPLPSLDEGSKRRLTLSEILAIISLLVTIYFGIVSSRPSEQLERIIEQNAIMTEQQAKIIELTQEDQHLRDTLDSLSNSIDLLNDELDLLRDELKGHDEPADCSCQTNAQNGQE
jgi:hypothetical protein